MQKRAAYSLILDRYCTVLYCTVLYCTVLYCTESINVQYKTGVYYLADDSCTTNINMDRSMFGGFLGECNGNVCTMEDGETFTIPVDQCAVRGKNRALNINGADAPGAGVELTAVTTITCDNGVLSSSGGAGVVTPINVADGITCSSESV